uniref:Peptidase A2 domain-containing protein n=1 Tax=Strongyloides stercoralis TaxID=6248 RepID=A0A0K0E215_STRER
MFLTAVSDNVALDRYYHYVIDFNKFEESISTFEQVAERALSNLSMNDKIRRLNGVPSEDYSKRPIKVEKKEDLVGKEKECNFNLNNKELEVPSTVQFPKIQTVVLINRYSINALLDGGSDINILNKDVARTLNLYESDEGTNIKTIAGSEVMYQIKSPMSIQIKDRARITCSKNKLYSGPTPHSTQLLLGRLALGMFGIVVDYESHAYDVGDGFAVAPPQEYMSINPIKDYKVYVRSAPLPGEKEVIQTMVDHGIVMPTTAVEICDHCLINKLHSKEKRFIIDRRPINHMTIKLWSENRKTTTLIWL